MLPLVLLLALAGGSLEGAEPKKPKWAATDLSQVDEDFALQGEYVGRTAPENSAGIAVGLQVVALGSGMFDAVIYPGGLPGAGWTRKARLPLHGERAGDELLLNGVGIAARVADGAATLLLSDGRAYGTLKKTRRRSPREGLAMPANGTPLFTGSWKKGFKDAKVTPEGYLAVGTETRQPLRDYTMHVEFRLPYMPYARGQGRANSGVYLQSRYEVQILDSFGLEGKENECGALYKYKAPDVNMCYPPLSWQTYDISFRSPRFDRDGKKVANARLSLVHNGVTVQNDFEVERKTGAGKPEGPVNLPIKLQDHSNPVVFRNVWIVDHDQPMPEPVPACPPLPWLPAPGWGPPPPWMPPPPWQPGPAWPPPVWMPCPGPYGPW